MKVSISELDRFIELACSKMSLFLFARTFSGSKCFNLLMPWRDATLAIKQKEGTVQGQEQ